MKLIDKIEIILKDYPHTRDSDVRLWLLFLKLYYPGTFDSNGYIDPKKLFSVPLHGHIARLRALIQNEHKKNETKRPKYLPTSWDVAKQRGIREITWRQYIKEQKATYTGQLSLID